jgi:uncharacterized protein (DUF983 family)
MMRSRSTGLPSPGRLLLRAVLRRCPNCGSRGIFAGYTTLRERCPTCGLRLRRGESDYFIGAYLLNLVAVEILFALLLGAVVVITYPNTPWVLLQWSAIILILGGALLCYPFAKALWLAADLIFRPLTDKELAWHREGSAADREPPHL